MRDDFAGTLRPPRGAQMLGRLCQVSVRVALASLAILCAQPGLKAADCPAERKPNLSAPDDSAVNIDNYKKLLRAYHKSDPADAHNSPYEQDIKLVIDDALKHVMNSYDKVKQPAVVLDIDETSLSNWKNIDADDFGFIKEGSCSLEPGYPCGFDAWITKARAARIDATLDFFNAVRAKKIAVFFITGRRAAQRKATIRNLTRAGFENWSGLVTRPDEDHDKSIVGFKSGEREKLETKKHYTIIANIGDQRSDLAGNASGPHAECGFKFPNPFYFIP